MTTWANLSDETKDGILFEGRLLAAIARSPARQERNRLYRAKVTIAMVFAKSKTKEYLVSVLMWHNPAYIRHLLENDDFYGLCSRFAYTFWNRFEEKA